jgi:hypothetical protein
MLLLRPLVVLVVLRIHKGQRQQWEGEAAALWWGERMEATSAVSSSSREPEEGMGVGIVV